MPTGIEILRERLETAVRGAPIVGPLTVAVLVNAHGRHAVNWYPQRRGQSSELTNFRDATRLLLQVYGDLEAMAFGPIQLQAVRILMVEAGWSRRHINAQCRRIRSIWAWAVSRGWLDPKILVALKAVAGLRRGRTAAPDLDPVKPPVPGAIDATMPWLKPVHRAIVRLMLLTGMRPGEACALVGAGICRTVDPWRYEPAAHKTAWLGRGRVIFFGPKSQLVLQPWLKPGALFQCPIRDVTYSSKTLGKVIERAIKAHGLTHWHLNQIRHDWATRIRDSMGIEAAQASLGHARIESSQVYAEKSIRLAIEVAKRFG